VIIFRVKKYQIQIKMNGNQPSSAGLEQLVGFYRSLIEQRVKSVRQGKIDTYEDTGLVLIEKDIAEDCGLVDRQSLLEFRTKTFKGELYDKLGVLQNQGDALQEICETVRDPLLDEAMLWLGLHKGLEKTSKDEFVEGFSPNLRAHTRRIATYLRTLCLLHVLEGNSDLIDKLNETSSYFPHDLFLTKKRKKTIRQVDEEISTVLPSLFSDDLVERMAKIDRYIIPNKRGLKRIGKYFIRTEVGFSWREYNPSFEQELDDLYNSREQKKEIYETLGECYNLMWELSRKEGKNLKCFKHSSIFRISPVAYLTARDAVRDHARNQVFSIWKASGRRNVVLTHLARTTCLEVRNLNGQLITEHKYSSVTFNVDSKFRNTTQLLPFCVAILNKYYTAAKNLQHSD